MTMTATRVGQMLRLIAIVVAIAGLVDPVFSVHRTVPLTVTISTDTPAGAAVSQQVQAELTRALGGSIRLNSADTPTDLILIGRPLAPPTLPDGLRVSTISVAGEASPNSWIDRVDAPERVPGGQAAAIVARVRARGLSGKAAAIVLEQQHVELARVEHTWKSNDDAFDASFMYAPPAVGLAALTIAVRPTDSEATTADNAAAFGMLVDGRRLNVLTYEPRPSWAAAFVRRALEGDPAFGVAASVRPSRGIDVTAGETAPIRAAALERFDAVVIGAPEELTAADVDALTTFAARRGGAVILLPDRRPSGPFLRLLPVSAFDEVLLENALALAVRGSGKLRGTEFALPRDPGAAGVTLATMSPRERAAVVWWPKGGGRILFGGALDAWRYRADDGDGFATFWRTAVSAAALAASPRVRVTVQPSVVAPGTAVRIAVAVRATEFDEGGARLSVPLVSAELITEDGSREAMRLWPSSEAGTYDATIEPPRAGRYNVRVTSGSATSDAIFLVRDGVSPASPDDRDVLAALAAAGGGRAASVTDLSAIVEHLRHANRPQVARDMHPLRSPWWIAPFALALCGEWVLRRRAGQP